MRIVYIANVFPYPQISGHRIRNFNLLKRLAEEHELNLFLLVPELPTEGDFNALGAFSHSIQCFKQPDMGAMDQPLLAAWFLLKRMPPDFRGYYNKNLIDALTDFFHKNDVHIVQIEDPCMAQYVETIPPDRKIKKVLTFHDINFRKFKRIAQLETRWKRKIRLRIHSKILERWEPKYAAKFDLCVTMSVNDADLLSHRNARLVIETIPNGVDTKTIKFQPQKKPSHGLIFVGNMDYRPNIDAVSYFCKEVMPKMIDKMPDTHFYIVGINPSSEVLALASSSVSVTGKVDLLAPWYSRCGVSVIPLRAGGGTRLKILESLAYGCPVVSTTIGAEGLNLDDGSHLLIADDSNDFSSKILSILQDNDLRLNLIYNGRERVVNYYDWDMIAGKLLDRYQQLVKPGFN